MIIGFSKHGQGAGSGPVDYLIAGMPLNYLLSDSKHGEKRKPAPVILRGDPAKTRDLIDSLPFKFRYTSGVLSFAPEDHVPPAREAAIMDEFEKTAFAGLKRSQYDILWIRHTHTDRHEMHFLVPRCELRSGKSLNISPPHSRPLFDILRTSINLRYNFADPDDPARRRDVSLPNHIARIQAKAERAGKTTRAVLQTNIAQYIQSGVNTGAIQSRNDVLTAIDKAGVTVVRIGRDYITIKHPHTDTRLRLRGAYFRSDFDPRNTNTRGDDHPHRQLVVEKQLRQLTTKRAEYNTRTYGEEAYPPPGKGVSLQSYAMRNIDSELFLNPPPQITNHDNTRTTSPRHSGSPGGRGKDAPTRAGRTTRYLGEASERWCRACRNFERQARITGIALENVTTATRERKQAEAIFRSHGIYAPKAGASRQRDYQREREQ